MEITIIGTDSDAKWIYQGLTRKDSKLTGELKDPTGKRTEATPSQIEEKY